MLLIPGDPGVNPLPLHTTRGHSYLGFTWGLLYGFYRALSLSAYCPYAWTKKDKKKCIPIALSDGASTHSC